jgi:hypothetical protein
MNDTKHRPQTGTNEMKQKSTVLKGDKQTMAKISWVRTLTGVVMLGLILAGASIARADNQPEPVHLNPDGTVLGVEIPVEDAIIEGAPPVMVGSGEMIVTDDELQPPKPNTTGRHFVIFVSSPADGAISALRYSDEDILRYDTKTKAWTKPFDGTNAGLPATADIDALGFKSINLGHIFYMSFDTPVAVPGLGTVDDSDIVAYRYVFGQGGSWSLYFKGSNNGLTTDGEDIDGIDIEGNVLYVTTLGNFAVPKAGGGTLSGGREDVIVYSSTLKKFANFLDGTTIGLAASNNIRGYSFVRYMDYDWHFLSLWEPAALKTTNSSYPAVNVKPNDIVVYEKPVIHGP